MANYFTDIVGGTREAFQRGYQNVENIRRDVGEQQAARALSRGDTRAAREAYGRAGMAEQVDVLAQREAAQAEAMRKREEEAKRQQQADQIAAEDRAAKQQEAQFKSAVDKMDFVGNIAQWLKNFQPEQRPEVLGKLAGTFTAMGFPSEVIAQVQSSSLDDQTLDAFTSFMKQEKDKLRPQANVSQYGATIYNPDTGQVIYTPAAGAPAPAAAAGIGKPPSGFRWTAEGELEAIPGGPADRTGPPRIDPVVARTAAKAFAAAVPFQSALDTYKKAIEDADIPAIGGFGPSGADLSSAHRALAMQLKGQAGLDLGALVGADFQILNDIIGEPGNMAKFFAQGGKAGAQKRLNQVQNILDARSAALKSEYMPYAATPELRRFYETTPPPPPSPAPSRQGAFVLRPGAPGAPPPSPQARATGSRANPPPYATAEERELWSDMTPEEQAAVWAGE